MEINYTIVQTDDTKYSIIASDDGIAGWIQLFEDGRWEFNPSGDYTFDVSDLKEIIKILELKQ